MPSYLTLAGFQTESLDKTKFTKDAAEYLGLGIRVDRATGDLPASTTGAIFTVSGGPVLLTFILGSVTTVIQTQACNYSLESDPTVAGSNVALCAVLDISAKAVGTYFTITGTLATAMSSGLAVIGQNTKLVVPAGSIVQKTSATNTGQVAWSMWYQPLVAGASVAAA